MGDWWVPYASLATAIVAVVVALLAKSPIVPRSQVLNLEKVIQEQSRRIERLEKDNKDLLDDNRRLERDNTRLLRRIAHLDQNGVH